MRERWGLPCSRRRSAIARHAATVSLPLLDSLSARGLFFSDERHFTSAVRHPTGGDFTSASRLCRRALGLAFRPLCDSARADGGG